jgi:hypothetical protein
VFVCRNIHHLLILGAGLSRLSQNKKTHIRDAELWVLEITYNNVDYTSTFQQKCFAFSNAITNNILHLLQSNDAHWVNKYM